MFSFPGLAAMSNSRDNLRLMPTFPLIREARIGTEAMIASDNTLAPLPCEKAHKHGSSPRCGEPFIALILNYPHSLGLSYCFEASMSVKLCENVFDVIIHSSRADVELIGN